MFQTQFITDQRHKENYSCYSEVTFFVPRYDLDCYNTSDRFKVTALPCVIFRMFFGLNCDKHNASDCILSISCFVL